MTAESGLNDDEHEAVDLLGKAAEVIRRIIGDGPLADHDWAEAAAQIHALQSMVLSQAARREYPERYRRLGHYGNWHTVRLPEGPLPLDAARDESFKAEVLAAFARPVKTCLAPWCGINGYPCLQTADCRRA